MTTVEEIQKEDGTWLFLVPIKGLVLSKIINNEYTIDKVTFIAASKLPHRRKKLGFPAKISDLKKRNKNILPSFFAEESVYATLRLSGKGNELRQKFLNTIREEIAILSLSQLGYSRRSHNASPAMFREYTPSQLSYLLLNTNNSFWTQSNETTGKLHSLKLDSHWKKFSKNVFFNPLVNIINQKTEVSNKWRKDIKNAAILAGQSQSSSDLPQCFLWNMIAIELLLTQQGDTYKDALPERTEAFIGWATDWKIENYQDRIRKAYQKRCEFVHKGIREQIEIEDLLFTDNVLLNIFTNIVCHPKIFYSKKQIIEFSEKIKAERLLCIKEKVRPKSLKFLNINYEEKDYKKI